ncbi:AraC family transcriptional regulator [Sinomicrobium pectinilyticum]|uniref:AraC family transcriptional regulator n=1 Tax=Sinomicrobium pectinilyticum TaxID=1084421 RepID=A0A3N0EQE3_SINP1|nr:helix-turn-helix domain-containing protein [Sinomicrobium pectinilyticum]RNL90090.1 AraC family transcriptional regulator [Sinomicrobium pectinilyticum]
MHCLSEYQFTSICRVLNQLSLGNLNYRLEFSDEDDDYDMLVMYINLIGDMGTLYLSEIMSRNDSIEPYTEITLHLNQNFTVKSINENLSKILNKLPKELEGKLFEELITHESLQVWSALKHNFTYHDIPSSSCKLFFKINTLIYYDCFCYLWKLPDNSIYISTHNSKTQTLEAIMEQLGIAPPKEEQIISPTPLSEEDKTKTLMLQIALYIEQHLDGSLPDMKTITRNFGVNEKKLKQSFKKHYHQTPYAYYMDKKLDRAMELLQTSRLSIEEVAFSIGYSAKSGFYEAFKKKFGMTPGKVVREG